MNAKSLAVVLLVVSLPVFADSIIRLPNGGTCFVQSGTGVVFGCSGGEFNNNQNQPSPYERGPNVQKAGMLSECLRKSDWPGMPGRSECMRMYGED